MKATCKICSALLQENSQENTCEVCGFTPLTFLSEPSEAIKSIVDNYVVRYKNIWEKIKCVNDLLLKNLEIEKIIKEELQNLDESIIEKKRQIVELKTKELENKLHERNKTLIDSENLLNLIDANLDKEELENEIFSSGQELIRIEGQINGSNCEIQFSKKIKQGFPNIVIGFRQKDSLPLVSLNQCLFIHQLPQDMNDFYMLEGNYGGITLIYELPFGIPEDWEYLFSCFSRNNTQKHAHHFYIQTITKINKDS